MFSFEFATAHRIIFGAGKLNELGKQIEKNIKRLLLVRGNSSQAIPRLREILSASGIPYAEFEVHGEPTIEVVREGVKAAGGCDLVIGLGGGSVLDTGKAIAALATNPGDMFDYLEVIGKGQPLVYVPLPYFAIPTTAGTGAEVTRNAVLESPEQNVKVSLRSPLMLPRLALVDPELTYSLPPEITASSGLDALTQLIEPFVSVRANPLTDAICREGMAYAARSLRRAYENSINLSERTLSRTHGPETDVREMHNPTDALYQEGMAHTKRSPQSAYENSTNLSERTLSRTHGPETDSQGMHESDVDKVSREGMSLASLFGGLALANAGLGAAHGFAGPLGGMLHAPHGVLCARLLPLVMEANIRALETRQPAHPALRRYAEVAQILTGEKDATALDGVAWARELVEVLKIPRLSAYGLRREDFPTALEKTQKASSYKGNPVALEEKELTSILEQAL